MGAELRRGWTGMNDVPSKGQTNVGGFAFGHTAPAHIYRGPQQSALCVTPQSMGSDSFYLCLCRNQAAEGWVNQRELRVSNQSTPEPVLSLKAAGIPCSGGPVPFGDDS